MAEATRSHYKFTFVALAVGVGVYSLLQSLVSPVLALLETDLHTSQDTVTWVLTAYLLSASVCTPILGRLGDMIGKKKVLVGVLAAVVVGAVLAALASSISVMILARAIQGIGGGLLPLSFGIVRDEFPPERVAGAVGAISAVIGVGGGLGFVLAGPIVSALDYHWLFWIPAIAVAAGAIATFLVVPESRERSPSKVSWTAGFLLSGWLVALLVAVSEAPSWGWGSHSVVGLLAAAVVLGMAWGYVERRSKHPLIDLRMLSLKAVWTTNLVTLLFGVGFYSVFAFLPEFIQTPSSAGYGFGASITESGLIIAPLAVTLFIFSSATGALSRRITARRVQILGSISTVGSLSMLAFVHRDVWEVAVAMALLGAGCGFSFSAISSLIVDAVPSSQTGVASGMNANIRTIGGAVGAAAVASIITSGVRPGALPKEAGYVAGFATLAAVSVFAALAGILVPKTARRRDAHQVQQAALSHPEAALVAAATIVGDEPE